jgi:hypothetical protein
MQFVRRPTPIQTAEIASFQTFDRRTFHIAAGDSHSRVRTAFDKSVQKFKIRTTQL